MESKIKRPENRRSNRDAIKPNKQKNFNTAESQCKRLHKQLTNGPCTIDCNPGGGKHRVAKYALMAGEWQGGKQS